MSLHERAAESLLEDGEAHGGPRPGPGEGDREWADTRARLAAGHALLAVAGQLGGIITLLEDCRTVLIDIRDEARKAREASR